MKLAVKGKAGIRQYTDAEVLAVEILAVALARENVEYKLLAGPTVTIGGYSHAGPKGKMHA